MQAFEGFTNAELVSRKQELGNRYEEYKKRNLKLDMSRGKPCTEQLELTNDMYDNVSPFLSEDGTDCRNYGILDGLKETKVLFSELFGVNTDEIFIGGNSSLNLMYDLIAKAYNHGLNGFEKPWSKVEGIKFLCPCPGYDRHFSITELFGISMIIVPMNNDGPDMEMIEELVKTTRPSKVCGQYLCIVILQEYPFQMMSSEDWPVWKLRPKTSQLSGITLMPFIIFTMNRTLFLVLLMSAKAGNPDRVYMFGSTSKVTFPGSGIAFMASSKNNIDYIKKLISIQTIGFDKINMLIHTRFLKNADNVKEHMKKHAAIIRPKFEAVNDILEKNLSGKGIASWNKPKGGYFISLDVLDGCAKRTVELSKEAGVTLTSAGATFPKGIDPNDRNIRIAPTYPPLSELKTAIEILSFV